MEFDTRLPTRHRQRLHYWLTAEGSPDDTLGLCGAHGLLCATVCAPEPVSPLHLASAVFGESGESYFQALPDREEGLGLLMALYHEVMNDAFEEALSLPPDCQVLEPAERNLAPGAPLREWSDGFERGYRLVSADWDKYCSQGMEDELSACLMSLMYFGPSERVAALRRETADDHDTTVEAFSEEVVQLIPTALKSYARMGLAIFDAIFEAETAFERDDALDVMPPPPKQPVRREKIGRNEPCPCGSGRKYKKCCRSPANS